MSRTAPRTLTPREAEVLELVSHGLTNGETGARLGVSVHAVKFHLASIYRKLGVANRTEAAAFYLEHLAPASTASADHDGSAGTFALEPTVLELLPQSADAGASPGPGREELPLGPALDEQVRTAEAPLHAVVLAAAAALLNRYTHLDTVVVRSGRSLTSVDVAGDPTFAELLERIQHDPSARRAGAGRVEIEVTGGGEPSSVELSLEDRDGLIAAASFDRDAVEVTTVRQLLRHLKALLAAGLADADTPVGTLELLTPEERHRALEEWNETSAPVPSRRVDEWVSAWAGERPEAVAVVYEADELSYAELDARVAALARYLVGLGVGPGALVGLCAERSLEMLVGLLAVMRAGGAYVPVDPAFPADRQRFMLEDAEVRVVVTQERLLPRLPAEGLTAVCLDRDWHAITATTDHVLPVVSGEDVAYVIYTSGSTGRPKGVQVPHRALANFLATMQECPGLAADDVLVAVTTLSFDIAGLELYLPLVAGARVVIAPHEVAADPRRLAALLEESGATVMQATPTTWRMLVDSGWRGRPGLKVLCGGEALPQVLAEQLLERELELWNMYGPTETTIWSSVSRVERGVPLTIGRPIANTELYVLDDRMQLLPPGVPGELHIGGAGLAHGYLKRPELTAEKFVPHPFQPAPARLYKTGDLTRYRPDGTIEFLGRRDHQVKLRGYRIELGEVETALARQQGVRAAVAVTREDEPGDVRLVGYVVPAPGATISTGELRRAVGETLPSYMVPSAIVELDTLPLTPNGKVDRKALPVPQAERTSERSAVAPRTPLEERLARIWQSELGIESIGVTDDFFDLGVTSIVAARLFARIEHELKGNLPLGALFRAPTVERLAALLEDPAEDHQWTSLVPIQPTGTKPPIFCVHGGAGTILHLQPLARRLGPDQPFYGLQERGLYGGAPPLTTIEEMAAHYIAELRSVQPHGPYFLGGYCFGSIVAFEMAQTFLREGEEVAFLAAFNGPSPVWIRDFWTRRVARQPPRWKRGLRRIGRVVVEPRRVIQYFRQKYIWSSQIRSSLEQGLPIPEHLRETYFLTLNARAEVAYHPKPYRGLMAVFSGDGLYPDDLTLGWSGLAEPLEVYSIPGHHTDNRDMMADPHVAHVAGHLEKLLAAATAAAG